MLQRIELPTVPLFQAAHPAARLWRRFRHALVRGAFTYFLIAAVLLPLGLLAFVAWERETGSPLIYFVPALAVMLLLAIAAWRGHVQLETTVELRTRALTSAITEKDQLLKEVHHRVKNNMQIISSLIRMQERVKTSSDETIRRVQAMALVHDLIYTQGQFANVDLAAYTRRLCETLREAGGRTTFDLTLDPVTITLDRAMPFALILSEVVTNATKHALRDADGTVAITLGVRGGVVKLTVRDDGTAFNPEVDGRGFGLRLVDSLSLQLDAVTSFERDHGNTFQMTFPAG
ncbi:MAG TPA: sensor histidine kinase [Microvirga sp.]|jgi:two-component sensor histidine kinase